MNQDPIDKQLENHFKQIWPLTQEQLELELGRRLKLSFDELSCGDITPVARNKASIMGARETFLELTNGFLNKFNRQLYSLACDPSDPDNKVIEDAMTKGSEKLGLVLSGVLLAHFGWLPAVATVVAALIAKRFVNAAYSQVCETWKSGLTSAPTTPEAKVNESNTVPSDGHAQEAHENPAT